MKLTNLVSLTVVVSLSLASSLSFADSSVNSNVKPIPDNFSGKWAGLHSTKKKLTAATLKDLCDNGGEQDTSFFVTFDPDRQRSSNVSYWEDVYTEYPVSYSKYTPNHISGQSLSISFEIGSEDSLSTKTFSKFDYKIVNGRLFIGTVDGKSIEMGRCT